MFQDTARANRIDFSAAQEPLPAVYSDPGKLTWVLNNLLSNAFKYTGPGGRVYVEAHPAGSFAEISVADDGEGILPEFLGRVFDKYVQAPSEDLEARGSGLGLYAAKTIVTEHGGQIRVQSEPQKGSVFTFTVPLYREGCE